MAGISCKPVKGALRPGLVFVRTRLAIAAGGAVDATNSYNGAAGAWTKTATGEYTYTFNSGHAVNGAGVPLGGTSIATGKSATVQNVEVEKKSEDYTAATPTLVLRTYQFDPTAASIALAKTAVDAGAAYVIDVHIDLFDSSVT